MTQVRSKSLHKQGREFDLPDDRVATAAQEAADATRPVCAARHDEPGFFTPCVVACAGPCACGEAVRAEVEGEGK